jgi:hypothetical protein
MAIACPCPNSNSSFSQLVISVAFTAGFNLPFCRKPFFSASFLKSSGVFPVFALMLSI